MGDDEPLALEDCGGGPLQPLLALEDEQVADNIPVEAEVEDPVLDQAPAALGDEAKAKEKVEQVLKMQRDYLQCVVQTSKVYRVPRPAGDPLTFQVMRNVQRDWVFVKTVKD